MFHLQNATTTTVREVLVRNVPRDTVLYTDESRLYVVTGKEYAKHDTVKHSAKEYARREGKLVVHTKTIENAAKPIFTATLLNPISGITAAPPLA